MGKRVEECGDKVILLGKSPKELKALAVSWGMPAYTGSQLVDWIYHKRAMSFDKMSNISLKHREILSKRADVGLYAPIKEAISIDGTRKYLFEVGEGKFVETVLIPEGERNTLCISSQVGCKMNCYFCMTGKQGFRGNLTSAQILNQCLSLPIWEKVSNIVFMGMGEPMDNIDNVLQTIQLLTDPNTLAMSPKRITVSTVGINHGIHRFLEECQCHLAISLHNPIPYERANLMPAEKAMPINELIKLLQKYDFTKQRRITFEYIVFSGLNDTHTHLQALIKIVRNFPSCRLNLIRYHKIPLVDLPETNDKQLQAFFNALVANAVNVTIRQSRGEDIDAACGMLSTKQLVEKRRSEYL